MIWWRADWSSKPGALSAGIDRQRGLVVIKPSGVPYSGMKPEHMTVVSLADGKRVEGEFKPSSDTDTHLDCFTARFRKLAAWFTRTVSMPRPGRRLARAFLPTARRRRIIEVWRCPLHAFVEATAEIQKKDYEANTGRLIVETFKKTNPMEHPAVLVASHGPFTWGTDVADAVHNAGVLEFIARLASETLRINPKTKPMQSVLLQKHFLRKHGPNATYGQSNHKK